MNAKKVWNCQFYSINFKKNLFPLLWIIVLYVSLYCPSFIEQNSGIILTMTMKSNNTQDLTSIEVSQLQYLPPLPLIWVSPIQYPDTLLAGLQMWRIHNLNQPGPWWWKWDQLFCWNLIKPTPLTFVFPQCQRTQWASSPLVEDAQ